MIARLPRWVWPVAWLLAFAAGAVNAVGLLGIAHQAVSHLTGTTTLAAIALVTGDAATLGQLVGVAAAFVAGAMVSGLVIPNDPLRLGRRQSGVLAAVAAVLVGAAWLAPRAPAAGLWLAGAACGLQNAMTTAYSGAVVRTSHVSGMFTDLGIALGHALRGGAVDRRRVLLCVAVIAGFLAGGLAAALAYRRVGAGALLLPAAITAGLAMINAVHVTRQRRRAAG